MQKISFGLTGNQLKIIAVIAMTLDHIGVQLMPSAWWLKMIGRLALPLFAYKIAEGCRYTKNKTKYFSMIFGLAFLCQAGYFIAEKSLYQSILVTFSLSIVLIYAIDNFIKTKSVLNGFFAGLVFLSVIFLTEILPKILSNTDYAIDYGVWGVMLPVLAYIGKSKVQSLAYMSFGLVMLAFEVGDIQWLGLVGILILMLYDGSRGKYKMKYFFYIYYPLHLIAIYLVSLFINN